MSRRRTSSYVESSDDDFAESDDDGTPVFSRLKRMRKNSSRKEHPISLSPRKSSFDIRDDDDEVICVPDSLEEEEDELFKPLDEVVAATPRDPKNEISVESVGQVSNATELEDGEGGEEQDEGDTGLGDHDSDDDNSKSKPAPKKRTRYLSEESNGEPSDDDDDDAYNSAEDSPGDDDSEFEPSPKRTPRKVVPKKPVGGKPKPRALPKSKKVPASKTAARTLKTIAKPSTTKKPLSRAPGSSAKLRLGARFPGKASSLGKKGDKESKARPTSLKLHSSSTLRSGLSRNANIPRLHSYLKR